MTCVVFASVPVIKRVPASSAKFAKGDLLPQCPQG